MERYLFCFRKREAPGSLCDRDTGALTHRQQGDREKGPRLHPNLVLLVQQP